MKMFSAPAALTPSAWVLAAVSLGVNLAGTGVVSGQEYPNKTVRILAAGAGSGGDFTARLLAPGLAQGLGQTVIVDNRPGSLPASDAASKSPPDGYTLLVNGASLWVIPLVQKVPYDVVRDFAPISLVERGILTVAVHPSLPVKSIKDLIALAKAKPGQLNYASGAPGGPTHLAMELLKSMAGVNIVGVPYKGTTPAVTALITGEVQLTVVDAFLVTPHAKSGKMRALAITSPEPSALAPGLPTVAAAGFPGYEATPMTGILAPAKTPAAIINRLNQEVVRVLNRPEVKERFFNTGVEIIGSTPEQFASTLKSEIAKASKIISDAGIKAD